MSFFHQSVSFENHAPGGDGQDDDIIAERSNPENLIDLLNPPTEEEQHDYWSGILAMGDTALGDSNEQES